MIKVYDKDGNEFQKETVDARECVDVLGWSYEKPEKQEQNEVVDDKEKTEPVKNIQSNKK